MCKARQALRLSPAPTEQCAPHQAPALSPRRRVPTTARSLLPGEMGYTDDARRGSLLLAAQSAAAPGPPRHRRSGSAPLPLWPGGFTGRAGWRRGGGGGSFAPNEPQTMILKARSWRLSQRIRRSKGQTIFMVITGILAFFTLTRSQAYCGVF